jgi:preprotein translocase subunit SecG
MQTLVLIVHLLIALALICVVLLQRSEGGALGIGGGGAGAMFSSRGAANALTRATAVLAAAFIATSITLTLFARHANAPSSPFDSVTPSQQAPAQPGGQEGAAPVLPKLPPSNQPQVPVGQ